MFYMCFGQGPNGRVYIVELRQYRVPTPGKNATLGTKLPSFTLSQILLPLAAVRTKTILVSGKPVKLYSLDGKTRFSERSDYRAFKTRRIREKDQMGHSSIKVTVDIYGHLLPPGRRQAGRQAGNNSHKENGLKKVWKQKVETIRQKIRFDGRKLLKCLARPEGFEPPTLRSEV